MGRNRTLGAPYEQQVITGGDFQTEARIDRYLVNNTSTSGVAVTLDPNAFNGDQVTLIDVAGNATSLPITVSYQGQNVASISSSFGSLDLTFSAALNQWSYTVGSSGNTALAINTLLNRTTTLPMPAVPFDVPTSDGADAQLMSLTIGPSDPTSGSQATAINVHGYVGVQNTATAIRQISVNVETALGTPIYTTSATLPASSGGTDAVATIPFDADLPFTAANTTVSITVVDTTPGASGTDVVVPALSSNMIVQEVAAGQLRPM